MARPEPPRVSSTGPAREAEWTFTPIVTVCDMDDRLIREYPGHGFTGPPGFTERLARARAVGDAQEQSRLAAIASDLDPAILQAYPNKVCSVVDAKKGVHRIGVLGSEISAAFFAEDGQGRAVFIKKFKPGNGDFQGAREESCLMRLVIREDGHKNVVSYLPLPSGARAGYTVLNSGGPTDLLDCMRLWLAGEAPHDQRARLQILLRVLEGLEHLHYYGVPHNDIKPENIMYDASKHDAASGAIAEPVIIDFGFAKFAPRLTRGPSAKSVASSGFRPPEVQRNIDALLYGQAIEPYDAMAADMYSFGCTMYYVMTLQPLAGHRIFRPPFHGAPPSDMVHNFGGVDHVRVQQFQDECTQLIQDLIALAPEDRPTASAAMQRLSAILGEPVPAPCRPARSQYLPVERVVTDVRPD